MKLILIMITILLTGCATTVPEVPKEVYIPVIKKCYDKEIPVKPKLCIDSLNKNETTDIILNCSLKDINTLEVYSSELETFICK